MIDIKADVVRYEQIQLAVIIVIQERGSSGPSWIGNSRLVGDVGKGPVAVVVIESAPGSLVRLEQFDSQRVDQENIQIAVVVIIKEHYSAAHRLDYIFLFPRP